MAKRKSNEEIVLSMVEQGKTRKQILDYLYKRNPDVTRKSYTGIVSKILKKHELTVESGATRGRKKMEIKVVSKKKSSTKKTAPKKKVAPKKNNKKGVVEVTPNTPNLPF